MAPTNLQPEKGTTLFGLSIFWAAIATLVLLLRVWSRYTLSTNKFGWDDWTAIAAWPLVVGTMAISALMIRSGFGLHAASLEPESLSQCLKLFFAVAIIYNQGIGLIRISALCFYMRALKSREKFFRYCLWSGIVANAMWVLGFLLVIIFQCKPIYAFWDRSAEGYQCIELFPTQLGSGITSVVLDLWVLLAPMPVLWKLQMKRSKKVGLATIFLMGYTVVVFSIGRMASTLMAGKSLTTDFTYAFVTSQYWCTCELGVSFVCVCIPSVWQLFRRAKNHGLSALWNDHEYTTIPNPVRSHLRHQSTDKLVNSTSMLKKPDRLLSHASWDSKAESTQDRLLSHNSWDSRAPSGQDRLSHNSWDTREQSWQDNFPSYDSRGPILQATQNRPPSNDYWDRPAQVMEDRLLSHDSWIPTAQETQDRTASQA